MKEKTDKEFLYFDQCLELYISTVVVEIELSTCCRQTIIVKCKGMLGGGVRCHHESHPSLYLHIEVFEQTLTCCLN